MKIIHRIQWPTWAAAGVAAIAWASPTHLVVRLLLSAVVAFALGLDLSRPARRRARQGAGR